MNHADFIVWMLCFPIMVQVTEWIRFQYTREKVVFDDIKGSVARMVIFALWLGVGYLLW